MSTIDDLRSLVNSGRILFDPVHAELLRRELLGTPPAAFVRPELQNLVLWVCTRLPPGRAVRISSLIRAGGHHSQGRAVDIGNEEIASDLLPLVAVPSEVQNHAIDEIIFDSTLLPGEINANRYNFNGGIPYNYDAATVARHRDHIHLSVR